MNKNELVQLLADNWSTRRIANHYGCSQSTIRHWLSKFELKSNLIGSRESREGIVTICKKCGKSYIYSRRVGHRSTRCSTCIRGINGNISKRIRYARRKKEYVEYKGGKCEICGYNRCLKALTFHHLDQGIKEFNISFARGKAWSIVKAELDKCKLLCFNCHTEEHNRLGNTGVKYNGIMAQR